jgi:hypothetical protein
MSIVVTVAEELKFLVPALDELLVWVGRIMARTSGPRSGHGVDYSEVERTVAEAVAQIERATHQGVLQSLDVNAPRLMIRGKTYERVGRSDGNYYTLAGPCQVARTVYREVGQPAGPLVDPVSLRAGVVLEGWLPQTAQAMAYQVQMNTAREAQKAAKETCRLPYSDSSFERVAHAVGSLYQTNELDVEQQLIEAYQVPPEATGVSVSLDRVSVPMEEPHPQDPEAIVRVFRMAFCGTVTVHDREGKALDTIRYGRMPQGDAVGLMEAMASDVDVMRQQRPDLLVTALADGAADVWELLDSHINKQELRTDVARLVDLWHNVEKLGKAARVIHGEQRSDGVVTRWKLLLLNDSTAVEQILAELYASGRREVRVGETRPVHEGITYLENHRAQMDYATARRQGRPVGSGPVEATCKSLFEVRMKRPGARWKQGTGEDIVRLRALALSDRWQPAMRLVLAPLRTAVQRAASST